jgi:hypothetical protein
MTIPAGSPIWSRTASVATYGGSATKRDYGGIGAVNANTDITAAQYMRLVADAAASAMMSPICLLQLRRAASTITVDYVLPCWTEKWFSAYGGSAPPSSLYPTVTIVNSTTVQLQFPVTAADAYGVSAPISILMLVPLYLGSFWVPSVTPGVAQIGGYAFAGSDTICPVLVF